MTSIRSFSEILRDTDGIGQMEKTKYASIIHGEAIRLTRLLDDLLDLSVLENGQVNLNVETGKLEDVRSEEHTSELQSLTNLVCRLLLEKKKKRPRPPVYIKSKNVAPQQQ